MLASSDDIVMNPTLLTFAGLYFQIRDDYCNLSLKEYSENKSFCEDLTEGKFSFPIIHAIQSQDTDKQVLRKYFIIRLMF